ncbi:SDR family oxidoreductase [Salinarimonas soli]|uniref:SDR family oxidoreductase n=1 Tax=Salinarimonas soli TaxID=1638099 RepID=A0A5B2VSM3_9HYPH|nr:SDR family oxidoreductase [Salinarimonas soli]KAA2242241.1 SDR family oxidoreductase [Salinarimonas soli]
MAKAALVTGGAVRIGRRIVERLAAEGYAVAIHCRSSRHEGEALAAALREAGGRAAVVQGDLASADDVARLVPEAAAALGPLTLLVNNASEFEPDEVGTLAPERFDRHMAVNLRAPAFLTQAFAAQAPAGVDNLVVNIIDQRVWKPTPLFFSYTLAKSALLTATRTMAQALAPRVRVNAIGPGPTLTSVRQGDEDFRRQYEALPLRRSSSPDEVADAVLFFARAPSVTGQMLALDGGQHLAWETPDVVGVRE